MLTLLAWHRPFYTGALKKSSERRKKTGNQAMWPGEKRAVLHWLALSGPIEEAGGRVEARLLGVRLCVCWFIKVERHVGRSSISKMGVRGDLGDHMRGALGRMLAVA